MYCHVQPLLRKPSEKVSYDSDERWNYEDDKTVMLLGYYG